MHCIYLCSNISSPCEGDTCGEVVCRAVHWVQGLSLSPAVSRGTETGERNSGNTPEDGTGTQTCHEQVS